MVNKHHPKPKWRKEVWKDKQGNVLGHALVKRYKGKITGVIYSSRLKKAKKRDLVGAKRYSA